MNKNNIIFSVILLILIFCSAGAIEFKVIIDPDNSYYHTDYADTFYMGNIDLALELQMANNDGVDWCAYSLPLRLYGTGAITTVNLVDGGGTVVPSIVRKNGFEEDGGIWGTMNSIYAWSWDGSFPDTMNHTVVGCMSEIRDGWEPETGELLTRLEFHFNVPLQGLDTGSVCIDSTDIAEGEKYDWLFSIPQSFGGPYCFRFANAVCGDANTDGGINILDVVFLINFKYKEGPEPVLFFICDVNQDDLINILDIVGIINFKYKEGDPLNCASE